ncbi:Inherit from euNOG: Crinkler (CRN) family protein [Seminavis robusta]|uniref:Inherit from euNOG: Crinkler (CRN) family protein n=1 Tax=Seminavis robusta TaxID=568900 RepID=A0A9N8HNC8_9STRA|nr:Inherit from euNOG: Crinkler (CRN) family protein [Seminavis robusta]|eukprot:Sro982_g227690.1 Inherit from euNOG: Crinkler (CRN) family protein (455) ;mRNA; f:21522-22970
MDLLLAFEVVRALLQEFGIVPPDGICSLFVGVDEYQSIPPGSLYDKRYDQIHDAFKRAPAQVDISDQLKGIMKVSNLWKLIEKFDQCRNISNLHIYPAFAGTKFGVLSIAGSSVPETCRRPLSFLTPQGMEDAIRSGNNKEKLVNDQFREELFFLGGLPRPSIAFANGGSFEDIWHHYIASEWNIDSEEMLLLIAYAISREKVNPEDKSGIRGLKWLAAKTARPTTLVEKCMVQNLNFLVDHVDKSLYVAEAWQQWELFGAAFFALRVNAIILLDSSDGSGIPFARLCEHAVTHGCDQIVDLLPMEVIQIAETLSTELPKTITSKKSRQIHNWVNGEVRKDTLGETVTYCVLNGTSGEGVDIFCALQRSGTSEFLFYADGCLASHPAASPCIDVNLDNCSTLKLLTSVATIVDEIIENRPFEDLQAFSDFCTQSGRELSADDSSRCIVFRRSAG